MKKLIFLIAFLSSSVIFADDENQMTPLTEWAEDNTTFEDGSAILEQSSILYLSYRCSALYGMMFALISNAPQEEAPEVAKNLENAQLTYVKLAEIMYNELTPENERDFSDNLSRSVIPMADNYQKEANKSWINSGEYFNDYIQNDASICSIFLEELYE